MSIFTNWSLWRLALQKINVACPPWEPWILFILRYAHFNNIIILVCVVFLFFNLYETFTRRVSYGISHIPRDVSIYVTSQHQTLLISNVFNSYNLATNLIHCNRDKNSYYTANISGFPKLSDYIFVSHRPIPRVWTSYIYYIS